jgi:ankyrin repeat protein
LDETYERTLLDIDEENWEYAHRLFQCIVVARRPLRVEELAEFLAFKSETGGSLTFQGDWQPENPREMVLSTCSSFVVVVNVDGSAVMQFSHFSVKEYLTSSRISVGRVSRYYIPLEPAHLFVTQACLCFLIQLDEHVTKEIVKELPLARYAGQYWANHAEFGNVASNAEDMIKRLFNPKSYHFANWVWIYDTISHQFTGPEGPSSSRPKLTPLHYAAQHGFHRVAEWLITTCSQDANVLGPGSTTPLHTASRNGRFAVAQVLLKYHAEVNAATYDGQTPLLLASWFGHPNVARLLLEHGADVNSKTQLSETPLRMLSEGTGNLEIAQLLLERGADPNFRSSTGRDSLYMALRKDHHGLAQLLLKHGADPHTRDVEGRTLLHVSAEEIDLKAAQGLLKLGVDVNSRDSRGRTPLQIASKIRDEEFVQILLQHGAKDT